MQTVKQSYFKYIRGTARYWGDLGLLGWGLTSNQAIQIIYPHFYPIFRCIKNLKSAGRKGLRVFYCFI